MRIKGMEDKSKWPDNLTQQKRPCRTRQGQAELASALDRLILVRLLASRASLRFTGWTTVYPHRRTNSKFNTCQPRGFIVDQVHPPTPINAAIHTKRCRGRVQQLVRSQVGTEEPGPSDFPEPPSKS